MSDWKLEPPPAPPGPVDKPDPTDPAWAKWIRDQLEVRLPAILPPATVFMELPNYDASLTVEPGELVTFAVEGDNPTPWAPDGGRIDVELNPGPIVDITRYKRVYPGITLQDYRKYTITVRYRWGNNVLKAFFVGGRYDVTYTWIFWKPEGQPRKEKDRAVYRFKKTSYGNQISVGFSIGTGTSTVPLGASMTVGGKIKVEDPQPPPPDNPKPPDEKDLSRPRTIGLGENDLLKVLSAAAVPGQPGNFTFSSAKPAAMPTTAEPREITLDTKIASILGVYSPTVPLAGSFTVPDPTGKSAGLVLGWYLENRDVVDNETLIWVSADEMRRASEADHGPAGRA